MSIPDNSMNTRRFSASFDGESFEIAADVRHAGADLLFFLHGLGCSKDSFRHVWDCADFAEYSILAIDLVGFGDSDKPENFPYTMKAQGQVAADVLAEFSDKKLHVVAHSMGGAVALLLPAEILNSIETFANVEGNLIADDCKEISRDIVKDLPDVFASEKMPELRAKYAGFGEGCTAIDSTTADVLYRSSLSLVKRSDSEELLGTFHKMDECRKAYFYGENSKHPALARLEGILKIEIKRSGHFPMNNNPEDFYDELHKFVTG